MYSAPVWVCYQTSVVHYLFSVICYQLVRVSMSERSRIDAPLVSAATQA